MERLLYLTVQRRSSYLNKFKEEGTKQQIKDLSKYGYRVMDAENKRVKALLVSEMVSRITVTEAVNIMHNIAISESINIAKMSWEKLSALENLQRVNPSEENESNLEI